MRVGRRTCLALTFTVGCVDGSGDLVAPEPTTHSEPCPEVPIDPDQLVTWTSGTGNGTRVEAPVCLGRMVPLSVGGGSPPYRWRLRSAASPQVALTEADQASARLWYGPGFNGQMELEVEDAQGRRAWAGVSSGGSYAAWAPRRTESGLELVDLCTGRTHGLPGGRPSDLDLRGRWLAYSAGGAVYRVDLLEDSPSAELIGPLPAEDYDVQVLWNNGALKLGGRERGWFVSPSGAAHAMEPDAYDVLHRVIGERSCFVFRARGEHYIVSEPEWRAVSLGQHLQTVRFTPAGRLLAVGADTIELFDLTGQRLASAPLAGRAYVGPDVAWVVDLQDEGGATLVRLRPGCVQRRRVPHPIRSVRWLKSGRAGMGHTLSGTVAAWVVADDDRLRIDTMPVLGRPDRGLGTHAPRQLLHGEDERNWILTLDAAAGLSDAFIIAERDVRDGGWDLSLSPDGVFAQDRREQLSVVFLSDREDEIIYRGWGEVRYYPMGLAFVVEEDLAQPRIQVRSDRGSKRCARGVRPPRQPPADPSQVVVGPAG